MACCRSLEATLRFLPLLFVRHRGLPLESALSKCLTFRDFFKYTRLSLKLSVKDFEKKTSANCFTWSDTKELLFHMEFFLSSIKNKAQRSMLPQLQKYFAHNTHFVSHFKEAARHKLVNQGSKNWFIRCPSDGNASLYKIRISAVIPHKLHC